MKVRLKTLTLGHLFLLHEIDSPFVNDFLPIGRNDLLKAIVICSQDFRKARHALLSRSTLVFVSVVALLNARTPSSTDREISKFQAYLKDNRERPAARRPPGGRVRNAPEAWRLLAFLMRDFRMELDQALHMSVRQANCLWTVQAELDGSIFLMPTSGLDEDRLKAFRSFAAEQEAKRRRN